MAQRSSERKSLADASKSSASSLKDGATAEAAHQGSRGGKPGKDGKKVYVLGAAFAVLGAIAAFIYLPQGDGLTAEERKALSEPPTPMETAPENAPPGGAPAKPRDPEGDELGPPPSPA